MKFENVHLAILLEQSNEGLVLSKRCEKAKFLKGYTGFKTLLKDGDTFRVDGTNKEVNLSAYNKIGSFKHSITKHKIAVDVYHQNRAKSRSKEYMRLEDSAKVLTASLDLKALKVLSKLN